MPLKRIFNHHFYHKLLVLDLHTLLKQIFHDITSQLFHFHDYLMVDVSVILSTFIILYSLCTIAPWTPKSNKHRLFSNRTLVTPSTREQQNKRTCITQTVNSPSQRTQLLSNH